MTGPRRPPIVSALGLAVVMGLAACSEGCGHELPVSDARPPQPVEALSVDELETLLWPGGDERWAPLPEVKLVALEQLVALLFRHAKAGSFSARRARRVAAFADHVGLELHLVRVEIDGEVETLWALLEPATRRQGRGSYLIRTGELEGEGRVEYLLQAPHSRYDKHSGAIALAMFLEAPAAGPRPRALFINSLHRYRRADGSKAKLSPPEANVADAAHATDHPIARATAAALRQRPLAIIQLHGFERDANAGDPDVIVSAGLPQPSEASGGVERRIRAAFSEFSVGHYGVDVHRLGGETNVQGAAARTSGRCFVHVETSAAFRERLLEQRGARDKLAAALFGADPKELRDGCP